MDLETLSNIVRELVRRITDKRDERALEELVDLILDLRTRKRELNTIAQVLHDEKTYVLSDTEILRGEEDRLIEIAAMYHTLYTMCRALASEDVEKNIDLNKAIEALSDKNLSDITIMLERAFRKYVNNRDREAVEFINKLNEALTGIRGDDLRTHLMRSIVIEARKLIERLSDRILA